MFEGMVIAKFLILLVALYFVIKIAVKNGIREAFVIEERMQEKEINKILDTAEE